MHVVIRFKSEEPFCKFNFFPSRKTRDCHLLLNLKEISKIQFQYHKVKQIRAVTFSRCLKVGEGGETIIIYLLSNIMHLQTNHINIEMVRA